MTKKMSGGSSGGFFSKEEEQQPEKVSSGGQVADGRRSIAEDVKCFTFSAINYKKILTAYLV